MSVSPYGCLSFVDTADDNSNDEDHTDHPSHHGSDVKGSPVGEGSTEIKRQRERERGRGERE